MKLARLVPPGLALLTGLGLAAPSPRTSTPPAPAAAAAAQTPATAKRVKRYIGSVPDTGQFLPDSVLIVQVDERIIRVKDYIASFFSSYPEFRPRPDSAGRLEFLGSLINKEVLGLTALAINKPLDFEDRLTLRQHTERVLSNVLYQRAVLDSVQVGEDEIRAIYEGYGFDQHFRHVLCDDQAAAKKLRLDLLAGRISWSDAVRRFSRAKNDKGPGGDLGFLPRKVLTPEAAIIAYALKPGETTVVEDAQGWHVLQAIERRPAAKPDYNATRVGILEILRDQRSSARAETLQAQIRTQIGMTYDSTNVGWAAAHFKENVLIHNEPLGPVLDLSGQLPDFAPEDTSRVLARYTGGKFTLSDFMHSYTQSTPALRANVNTFDAFRGQLDGMVLEPYMAQLALKRGLDRDSMAVVQIQNKREQMLVEHLYADSIQSHIFVTKAERQKYYQEHMNDYFTFPSVRFAALVRPTRSGADSLAARLRAGEKAEDILRADSLAGLNSGSIKDRRQDEHGPYQKLLFEELRPSQVTVEGPDKAGDFLVLQLLVYDKGRQLSYEESEQYVDESLQNMKSEARLKEFIGRYKKRHRIASHSELLMQIRLVDPTLDLD